MSVKILTSGGHAFTTNKRGEIKYFEDGDSYHDGPECEICGKYACVNCDKEFLTEKCSGRGGTIPGLEYPDIPEGQ